MKIEFVVLAPHHNHQLMRNFVGVVSDPLRTSGCTLYARNTLHSGRECTKLQSVAWCQQISGGRSSRNLSPSFLFAVKVLSSEGRCSPVVDDCSDARHSLKGGGRVAVFFASTTGGLAMVYTHNRRLYKVRILRTTKWHRTNHSLLSPAGGEHPRGGL